MVMDSHKKVAVIGQGYVGLPLALTAASVGHRVVGFDIDESRVQKINAGVSPVEDISDEILTQQLSDNNYRASHVPDDLASCEIIIIAVPTPLDPNGDVDYSFLYAACDLIAEFGESGATVITESTSSIGTLRNRIAPRINEKSQGKLFKFAISPERVDPGNEKWTIETTPRIVAGLDAAAANIVDTFYSTFCSDVRLVTSPEVAEAAKLLENTFRLINISFINQFSELMNSLNISAREVIAAAESKPYGYMKFMPGSGIGGHCIPVDPVYLLSNADEVGVNLTLVNEALHINDKRALYIVEKVGKQLNLSEASIVLAGVSYKRNISDVRETPADKVLESFKSHGAVVSYFDPYVDSWKSLTSLTAFELAADCIVILQWHDNFSKIDFKKSTNLVFDLTGEYLQAIQL